MSFLRCLFLLLAVLAGPAAAQPPAAQAPALSQGDLDHLSTILKDEARRNELLRTLNALSAASRARQAEAAPATPAAAAAEVEVKDTPAPAEPAAEEKPAEKPAAPPIIAPNTVGAQLLDAVSSRADVVGATLLTAIRTMADLPALVSAATNMLADPVARTRLVDASWKLLLAMGIGLLAERLAGRALGRPDAWLEAVARRPVTRWRWLRRVPLVLGRLVLALLPVVAFIAAGIAVLQLVQPLPTTRLVALTIGKIYLGARLGFIAARMLLAPGCEPLRLLPCSDLTAAYGITVLRRFLLIGVSGYALAEAGLFLGLPWAAYDTILNLTLLAVSLLLARLVLRYRRPVAEFLRANPLTPEEQAEGVSDARRFMRATRDRIGAVWHIGIILWLLAAWSVWALAVENGLHQLLVGTLLTVAVLAAAKLLDEGVARGLRGLAHPHPEAGAGWARFAARAAPYAPVLQTMASIAIGGATLVLLLETWGLDSLAWFAPGTLGWRVLQTLLSIATTVLLSILVWEVANGAIQRKLSKATTDSEAARSARVRTLLPMLRTVLGILIALFVLLNTLSQLGVNVAPLLAGAGVIGLAIGFGSQTLVRDVITGIFLLLEDAVAVGDVVQLGGLTGVVENLSIRSIKLRATDGSLHIVPFSAVTTVTNMTRDFAFAVLDITVPYSEDTDRVVRVLKELGGEIRAEAKWRPLIRDDIDVWGIDKMSDAGVTIRARVKTDPTQRWQVAREFNRRIKMRFDDEGIRVQKPQTMLLMAGEQPVPPELQRAAQ